MADNVTLPGTSDVIGADDVTIGGVLQKVQRVKLVDGSDGGTDLLPGTAGRGLAVEPRTRAVRVAPTAQPVGSTSPAYTAKDALGGLLTFANAARVGGGSIVVQGATLIDQSQQRQDLELVLFRATFTAPTDNAIFDPTNAELADVVGTIYFPIAYYSDFNDNSVCTLGGLAIPAVLSGTDLFGVIVVRSTITLAATSDIEVYLTILQD